MKKYFSLVKFFSIVSVGVMLVLTCSSVSSFAQCTQEEMETKLTILEFSSSLLEQNELKIEAFQAVAMPAMQRIQDLHYATVEQEDKKALAQICKEIDAVIDIADDIQAGGSGTGKKKLKPWKKHTPAEMVDLMEELTVICEEDSNNKCAGDEFFKFSELVDELEKKFDSGEISAPAFVDGMAEQVKLAIAFVKS